MRTHHLPHPNVRRPQLARPDDRLGALPKIHFRPAAHDRQIFLPRLPSFKNPTKFARRLRVLGHQHHSAGFPVQPGDDSEAGSVLNLIRQKLLQPAKKRRLRFQICRMHDQRRGLIHHDPVGGLVDHPEIDNNLKTHGRKNTQKSQRPENESLAIEKQTNPRD